MAVLTVSGDRARIVVGTPVIKPGLSRPSARPARRKNPFRARPPSPASRSDTFSVTRARIACTECVPAAFRCAGAGQLLGWCMVSCPPSERTDDPTYRFPCTKRCLPL